MQRIFYTFVFGLLFTVALVVLMPASVIQGAVNQRFVAQKIPLAMHCAQGGALGGEAIILSSVKSSSTALASVRWQLNPSAFLRGAIGMSIQLSPDDLKIRDCTQGKNISAVNAISGDVKLSIHFTSIGVSQANINVPAFIVAKLLEPRAAQFPALRLVDPQASIQLVTQDWRITHRSARYQFGAGASVTAKNVSVAQTQGEALGTYTFSFTQPKDDQWFAGTVASATDNALMFAGTIDANQSGLAQFVGSAFIDKTNPSISAEKRAKIAPLLPLIGPVGEDGKVVLKGEFGLR